MTEFHWFFSSLWGWRLKEKCLSTGSIYLLSFSMLILPRRHIFSPAFIFYWRGAWWIRAIFRFFGFFFLIYRQIESWEPRTWEMGPIFSSTEALHFVNIDWSQARQQHGSHRHRKVANQKLVLLKAYFISNSEKKNHFFLARLESNLRVLSFQWYKNQLRLVPCSWQHSLFFWFQSNSFWSIGRVVFVWTIFDLRRYLLFTLPILNAIASFFEDFNEYIFEML